MGGQSHTAEVWKACGTIYEHMVAEIRTGAKGEGEAVAQVWDGPEGFKRARLIAAAPELLEALRHATELLASANRSTDRPSSHVSRRVSEARAAIAKATGESAA